MMKVNCNIIGDMLPLYADDVVSEDTRAMVEEHLAECENCQEKYEDMKRALCVQTELSASEAEKQSLISVKKELKKKRMVTAILSVMAGIIIISVIVGLMNYIKIPVPYEEWRFEVYAREVDGEERLFLEYIGKMHGYEQMTMTDEYTGKKVMYVEIYTTLWRSLFGGNEDNVRNEIFCAVMNSDSRKIVGLRYIEGDFRQLYSPTRDEDKLEEDSVLLWELENGLKFREEGVYRTAEFTE